MTNELMFLGLGALVGVVVGWFLGNQGGGRRMRDQVTSLLGAVRTGDPSSLDKIIPGEVPVVRELRTLLGKEFAPRNSGAGGDAPSQAALERIANYLKVRVEEPLLEVLEGDEEALREGAESVVDSVEDIRFFLQDLPEDRDLESKNLVDLVGEVTRELGGDFMVRVQVDAPPEPLRVRVNAEPLKDALFLILHNAGEFGGGESVEMVLRKEEEAVRIFIRDQGPGFSAEALIKAMDPFYSTSPGGLGLGLPYARKAVEAQGGDLVLRNPEGGGGEVEIILPQ